MCYNVIRKEVKEMTIIELVKVMAQNGDETMVILEPNSTFEKKTGGYWEGTMNELINAYKNLGFYKTMCESEVIMLDNIKIDEHYLPHIVYKD